MWWKKKKQSLLCAWGGEGAVLCGTEVGSGQRSVFRSPVKIQARRCLHQSVGSAALTRGLTARVKRRSFFGLRAEQPLEPSPESGYCAFGLHRRRKSCSRFHDLRVDLPERLRAFCCCPDLKTQLPGHLQLKRVGVFC